MEDESSQMIVDKVLGMRTVEREVEVSLILSATIIFNIPTFPSSPLPFFSSSTDTIPTPQEAVEAAAEGTGEEEESRKVVLVEEFFVKYKN